MAIIVHQTNAQYSCQTATQLILKDSIALDSFSHSGFDDRWFTLSLNDSVSHIKFQWEWASKNTIVPFDSLIIYRDSCNQLVQHGIVAPIPLEIQFLFSNNTNVFFQFKKADSSPNYFEFNLGVFEILECMCVPNFLISKDQICLGECITITNKTDICNRTSKQFTLSITPSCVVTDNFPTPVTVTAGTINGNFYTSPNFLTANHELELCPIVAGEHTIHVQYYGYDSEFNQNVFCDITKTFMVFDLEENDFEIIAEGNPCPLIPMTINNNPVYGVPCCVDNIEFEFATNFPEAIISKEWIFHDNESLFTSYFDYYQSNWYNSSNGQVNVSTLLSELYLNCIDTFYLSLFVEYECGFDTITKAFILLPPQLDFDATTSCFCNPTGFLPSMIPDCSEAWLWNFGDGNILSSGTALQNVNHVYNNPGTYQVSLTAFYHNPVCSAVVSKPVLVENIDFQIAANKNPVCTHEQVEFSIDATCALSDGTTYFWLFGDGASSTLPAPVHEYLHTGNYTVTCSITICNVVYFKTYTISVLQGPDIEFVSGSNMACSPDNTWSLNISDPGYTYSWFVTVDNAIVYEEIDGGETFTFDWMQGYSNGGTIQVILYSHETNCYSEALFDVYPCCDESEFNADYIWTDETISGGGSYTDRTIIINGNVTLVDDYTFSFCKFYLAPYSTLFLGDKSKTFSETKFSNCRDTVWKEIHVLDGEGPISFLSDTIEFSEKGITMLVERPLLVRSSMFINNFLMSIEISNWENLPNHAIVNNHFICSHPDDMIYPYNNLYPEKGIYLNNNPIIEDFIFIGKSNYFSNLQHGVFSINSNVKVIGNVFENIDHFNQYNPIIKELYTFAAVYAEGKNKKTDHTIIIGDDGPNEGNNFIGCSQGVFIRRNYHTLITYNTFSDKLNGTAIRLQNMEGYNSGIYLYTNIGYVYNNTINEVGIGVSASCNKRSVINIEHNTINCFQQQNHISRGIVINGLKSTREKYSVRNNVINYATIGISANNTLGIVINLNNVLSLKEDFRPGRFGRGIHLTGSERSTIYSNNVIGASLPSTIKTIGIHIESSMRTDVFCDSLVNLGAGFRASFICTESRIFNNKFENSLEGITLSNGGIIGPQGGQYQPSDNEWLPSVASWTSAGRWPHYTYASDGSASTLYVKSGSQYPTFGINPDQF
jgi:PKD repeat protein